MLYPHDDQPMGADTFRQPGSAFRGAPFWAWNCQLTTEELLWQIEQLKLMGFGGFHMHVRTGMDTPYLSDDYMALISSCVEKARQEGMLAYLYDEDRWPSGAAGGLVTKGPEHRMQYLVLTWEPQSEGTPLAAYDIVLNDDGTLASYTMLEGEPKGFALYAHVHIMADHPWHNNQGYLNVLDPASVQAFIETTHERYAQVVGEDFGGLIPSIFTDEPHFHRKGNMNFARDTKPLILPWTKDLPDTFRQACGLDLVAGLPELLWELPGGKVSPLRYHYHDHVTERFAQAFSDQCGQWCQQHGLMLTGHMDEEATLESQTRALGEAMRNYRCFQLPGMDLLCDRREFTTAKQAQSAVRQYGREGVLSELYGVTNWDFDFRGQKLQGDWQAALGVTLRVPHLSWVSMNGHAKRDYPGTFNYQAPWYKEYRLLEDHYARINTAMTRGKPRCRVGVVHPIESYWLHWGSQEHTAAIRQQIEERFLGLTRWLLHGMIDFDFLCESLLPEQVGEITDASFPVGEMRYDVVIAPGLETIRATTLDMLCRFIAKGGRVMVLGDVPALVDALPSDEPGRILAGCQRCEFDRVAVLNVLQDIREVEIRSQTGGMAEGLLYQMRQEGDARWLLLCHGDKPANPDIPNGQELRIRLRGLWKLTVYDTLTGEIAPAAAVQHDGWTELRRMFYDHDSLLLHMEPGTADGQNGQPKESRTLAARFLRPVPYALAEPNCLLLDMPEYALDGEPYRPAEEILRIMEALYARLDWGVCNNRVAQPWAEQDLSTPHVLRLRYTFFSRRRLTGCRLALENAAASVVTLNGQEAGAVQGWYVDKCIGCRDLPEIQPGENVLEITVPFGKKTPVESCYLLGSFRVDVTGTVCTLDALPETLAFGDITRQGLPFYGGNVTYRVEAELSPGTYELDVTCYRGHLLRLAVDGKDCGALAFSPYRLRFEVEKAGCHCLELTCFGCRINTLGQLHQANKQEFWWGPDSWRSRDAAWTYEYAPWPQGVMKSPELFRIEREEQ
ncbi:MAG: hypothetical protein J6K13_00570 [Clostridia bacterium]|nr:hypothetical protein [Clostridia bacterium]